MGFSRQEYWSGLPFPSPADLPLPWIELGLLHCRQILYRLSHQGSKLIKNKAIQGELVGKDGSSPSHHQFLCWRSGAHCRMCYHLQVTGEDTVVRNSCSCSCMCFGSVLSPLQTPRMHTWGTRTPEKLHSLPSLPSSGRSEDTPHPTSWGTFVSTLTDGVTEERWTGFSVGTWPASGHLARARHGSRSHAWATKSPQPDLSPSSASSWGAKAGLLPSPPLGFLTCDVGMIAVPASWAW